MIPAYCQSGQHDMNVTGRLADGWGCRVCKREYQRSYRKDYNARFPEKVREWQRQTQLKRLYGISVEEYERLLAEQGGVCRICGQTEPRERTGGVPKYLAVDHDHQTGRIRGLLCHRCNSLLGMAKDRMETLKAAIEYLGAAT